MWPFKRKSLEEKQKEADARLKLQKARSKLAKTKKEYRNERFRALHETVRQPVLGTMTFSGLAKPIPKAAKPKKKRKQKVIYVKVK